MSKKIIKLCTAGSVDDGKSTLIGRMLLDSKLLTSNTTSDISTEADKINLAHVTDGLKEERELGITIDVAYRYFATEHTKYILADAPGHFEFTRNMITAASSSDILILIIDVNNGIVEQTRRHTYIASMLGIEHIIVCINKMDMVDYDEERYNVVKSNHLSLCAELRFESLRYVPISALQGDNVVNLSMHTPWYTGEPLIDTLEQTNMSKNNCEGSPSITIQGKLNHEGDTIYYGNILSGVITENQALLAYPPNKQVHLKSIYQNGQKVSIVKEASTIAFTLDETFDALSMLEDSAGKPSLFGTELKATLCWLDDNDMEEDEFLMKHITGLYDVSITAIESKLDINTYEACSFNGKLGMNDIAVANIQLERELPHMAYSTSRVLGSFILIHKESKQTVACGMIK